jgi:F-type H+-transporting ATPase subunit b
MLPLEGIDLGPLLPEHASELVVGIILFLLIWFIVAKKVVPVFEETYAERTAEISGGIEKAEAAQAEAAQTLAEHRAQLQGAREEASRIREDAKAQAAILAAEIRQQAQEESARLLESAKAQIDAERAHAVQQLRAEIGGLATGLAGKIVGESLEDDDRARRSVERFIAELEAENTAGRP